jgi:hypothetical protein
MTPEWREWPPTLTGAGGPRAFFPRRGLGPLVHCPREKLDEQEDAEAHQRER